MTKSGDSKNDTFPTQTWKSVYNYYAKHEFWKPLHSVQTSTSWLLQENVHSVLLFQPKCEPSHKPLVQTLPLPCPSFILLPVVCPGAALLQETLCAPRPRWAPEPTPPQNPRHSWVERYTPRHTPAELPLPLDRPSSIPRGSLAARDTLPRSRPSGFLPSCTSIHRQLFAMNHVLQANVSSTLEIFIRILILHLASFHVKNRNKMLNYNSSWNYYTTDLLTSFQSELQLAHFRTRNSLAVSVIAMLASWPKRTDIERWYQKEGWED